MDIEILKTELAKPAYSTMTNQEAADALNALTVETRPSKMVNERTIIDRLGFAGELFLQGIAAAEANFPADGLPGYPAGSGLLLRAVITRARQWMKPGGPVEDIGVDLKSPLTQQLLDILSVVNNPATEQPYLDPASVAIVKALGVKMISRAEELKPGAVVSADEVAYARQIMGVTSNG